MSYSFTVSGHSNENHNEAVKAAFDTLVEDLRAIPGNSGTAGGYSNDTTGRVELTANLAASQEGTP